MSSVSEGVELFRDILSPVGKFLSGIRITRLIVRCSVGGSDAAQTALQYGQMNAYIYGAAALLRNFFHLQIREISLYSDFLSQKTKLFFSFELRVSVFSILRAAFSAVGSFFRFVLKKKKKVRKKKTNSLLQEE